MEPAKENYLITVRILADTVSEWPIASYWVAEDQELVLLDWVEKLSSRMEFSSRFWGKQLQDQLQVIDDFFRSDAKIAKGEFPFQPQQMERFNIYRVGVDKSTILLRCLPLKTMMFTSSIHSS